MAITRWDPFRELETVNDRLNRFFGRGMLSEFPREAMTLSDWAPAVDVAETSEAFIVKAELPDMKKEDIKVSVEDGTLRIFGERTREKEEKQKRYHRVERSYGSFSRSFGLPGNVDEAKLSAEYKDGMLTVNLPKAAPSKPKALEVKVG